MTRIFLHLLLPVLLSAPLQAGAAAPGEGRVFDASSPILEADLGQRSEADRQSIELWLRPAPGAQEGDVIVDKLTPATG